MKYPTTIENSPRTLEELAKELGNLRYDSLATFLRALSNDLYQQAEADKKRERPQLAVQLYVASFYLEQAAERIEEAWKISEQYMKDNG